MIAVVICLAIGVSNVSAEAPLGHNEDKPNIVYILVDNWGWGDIGIQGSAILRLYCPLDPWYDKTWRPGEIELVK
jgi:hypothetical protein